MCAITTTDARARARERALARSDGPTARLASWSSPHFIVERARATVYCACGARARQSRFVHRAPCERATSCIGARSIARARFARAQSKPPGRSARAFCLLAAFRLALARLCSRHRPSPLNLARACGSAACRLRAPRSRSRSSSLFAHSPTVRTRGCASSVRIRVSGSRFAARRRARFLTRLLLSKRRFLFLIF